MAIHINVIILELINLGSVLSVAMGISNPILSITTFHTDIVVMDDRDDNNGDDAVTKSTLSSQMIFQIITVS